MGRQLTLLVAATIIGAAGLALGRPRIGQASVTAQADRGQTTYTERCEVCHGANGDGHGPAADLMFPRPRDFTAGSFKIRSTSSDSPPTDADLMEVIGSGMPGSTMPAWSAVLSRSEIEAVAGYLKSFSDEFEGDPPEPIAVGRRVRADEESIARGEAVYQELQCFKCHGEAGRGDGPSALTLADDLDNVIYPADLTQAWHFRGGGTAEDIYLRVMTGMTGSPMPSFADAIVNAEGEPDEQRRWDLVNYVDSLSPDTAPEPEAAIVAQPAPGPIPDDPLAAEWQEAEQYFYPLAGQIMREPRNFSPSITGVWVRALYNTSELALLVEWNDRVQNDGQDGQPADQIVVEFPASVPEGAERPYFVFGDEELAVNLWTWSPGADAALEQTGRGADAIAPQETQNVAGAGRYGAGRYSVVFRRALVTGDAEDIAFSPGMFIPITFAVSDGLNGEEPGAGSITSWYQIYLDQPVPALNYAWIPAAVIAAAVLEGGVLWALRRGAQRKT